MQHNILRLSIAILFLACLGQPLSADPATEAADRIKERLSQIDDLKAAGSIGENAKGYLERRGSLGPRQDALLAAENADRRVIYQSVANRTNQTSDDVGAQRAIQIAARARSGVWLQKPSGDWYQKP